MNDSIILAAMDAEVASLRKLSDEDYNNTTSSRTEYEITADTAVRTAIEQKGCELTEAEYQHVANLHYKWWNA